MDILRHLGGGRGAMVAPFWIKMAAGPMRKSHNANVSW